MKLTLREVCQQEFDRFQERFKSTKAKDYPLSVLLSFWAGEGRALYPNMARVARVLLSVPASAAVLERDFSTAGRLITGSRSRLAGEYVEMTLFLNGNTVRKSDEGGGASSAHQPQGRGGGPLYRRGGRRPRRGLRRQHQRRVRGRGYLRLDLEASAKSSGGMHLG